MPDDKVEEKVENTEEKSSEEKSEEFVSPGVDTRPKGVIEKITNVFKKKTDDSEEADTEYVDDVEFDSEEKSDAEDTNDVEQEDEPKYDEIDPKFVDVARKYGWEDRRIIEYAENHSEQDLILMANLMQDNVTKSVSDSAEDTKSSDDNSLDELLTLAGDDPKLKALVEKAIGPLAKRVADLSSSSEKLSTKLSEKEQSGVLKEELHNLDVANSVFDASEISSLGKTENIQKYPDGTYVVTDPVYKERSKVWDVAQMFYANGGTFKDAVKNSIQWYKGTSAEKDIKNKVIKDLKKTEERVMPKRSESKAEKTYANEEDRKAAIINDAVAKYNKEFPTP